MNESSDRTQRRRIWVITEGKHEEDGALLHLIRRLIPNLDDCDFEFDRWKNPRGRSRRFRSTERGDGIFKKFVAMLFDAEQYGFDAVIALVDCDRDRGRLHSVAKAQDELAAPVPRAFGVAVETFDAWFLADEKSLSTILETTISAQPDPESNSDAKTSIKSLRDESGSQLGLAELYSDLAQIFDTDLVARRCPKGFAVWKQRVEKLLE